MANSQAKSFAEVAFLEAVARRVRVDLVIDPVVPGGERRLISRFLGMAGSGRLALVPPQSARGLKVYIPDNEQVGLSFEIENIWCQARSLVLEHAMFQQSPVLRVDTLIVEQPRQLVSSNRRVAARHKLDPGVLHTATIWSAERITNEKFAPLARGRLSDWSETGLGVRVDGPLTLPIGEKVVILLEPAGTENRIYLQGVLQHCTPVEGGTWQAGVGNVSPLRPGDATGLMEFLAASTR
jgi:hypothetical protein